MSFKVPTTKPPPPPEEPVGTEPGQLSATMRAVHVADARASVRQAMYAANRVRESFETLGVVSADPADPIQRVMAILLELKEQADGL